MPPLHRNAQNLPLKTADARAGKPGREVLVWAADSSALGLMLFSHLTTGASRCLLGSAQPYASLCSTDFRTLQEKIRSCFLRCFFISQITLHVEGFL